MLSFVGRLILRWPAAGLSTTSLTGWIGSRLAMYAKRSEWHLVVKGFFAGQAFPMITSWGGCTGESTQGGQQAWWAVGRFGGRWEGRCGRAGDTHHGGRVDLKLLPDRVERLAH